MDLDMPKDILISDRVPEHGVGVIDEVLEVRWKWPAAERGRDEGVQRDINLRNEMRASVKRDRLDPHPRWVGPGRNRRRCGVKREGRSSIHSGIPGKRGEVRDVRLGRAVGARSLHQHGGPMRDAPHPYDGLFVHERNVAERVLCQARRHEHEEPRLDMQRLAGRLGVSLRLHTRSRFRISVAGPLQVMQAIQAEALMRSDPSNGTSFIAKGDLDFIATSIGHALELASDKRLDNITRLILRDAKAQALLNRKASWPHKGKLALDGFTFSIIDKDDQRDPSIAETELHWLDRQKTHDFSSQPYEQMASVLRSMGLQDDAIQVLVAKNLRFGQAEIRKKWGHAIHYIWSLGMVRPLNIEKAIEYSWKATWALCQLLWKICWYYGFGLLIGYGYMPWRALILSVVLIAIGWKVFEAAHKAHRMKPTDSMPWKDAEATNDPKYPPFNAFTYALEKFVPLVKLDMGDYWVPDGKEKPGKALLGFLHIYTFAGWVLTTLWFGGLTGLLKT